MHGVHVNETHLFPINIVHLFVRLPYAFIYEFNEWKKAVATTNKLTQVYRNF